MISKAAVRSQSPWGDDHPEKLNKTDVPKTIGFGQQIKGLLSPDAVMGQLFGQERRPEPIFSKKKEHLVRPHETLLFSYESRKTEQDTVKETQIVLQKLQEQIILLEKSEKNLSNEVAKIKIEQLPRKTGLYYIRYLEWLITIVRQLRFKVEEGRAWLATFTKRQKKRLGYWKMYKKHGTTFGLSHERTLATQTG